jgi:hypothetical protein
MTAMRIFDFKFNKNLNNNLSTQTIFVITENNPVSSYERDSLPAGFFGGGEVKRNGLTPP